MRTREMFGSIAWNGKGKVTRRERFLAEMDAVILWAPCLRLSNRKIYELSKAASHRD